MSVAQKANKSIELFIKETFCCRGFSSWVTWYFEEITVKVSVCWTPSSYLSLTSHFNVTPLWFAVPLTLPRYSYTSQQLSLILREKISRERPETTQKKTKGPKCHTLAVWGRRWRRRVVGPHMKAWQLPHALKAWPFRYLFQTSCDAWVFAQRGCAVLYESFHTFW